MESESKYQTSQRGAFCPLKQVDECVYNTQGNVKCSGYNTVGAEKEEWKQKFVKSQNDQLFQRVLDERFTWR
jgi:hypothetical protein